MNFTVTGNSYISALPEKVRDNLQKVGLNAPNSVLLLSDHELQKKADLTKEECCLARSSAAKCKVAGGVLTVADASQNLENSWRRLSVGCKKLDEFLHGGVRVQGITEIAGESGCGKTQLCLQMSLTVQYPYTAGGLNGGAVYICTEDAFPSRRLHELFHSFPPSFVKEEKDISFSDNIFIVHIGDSHNLKECIMERIPKLLTHRCIKLIILDSIAGVFRADYEPSDAMNRARDMQIIGCELHKLAKQHHLAVVCVNQVSDVVSNEAKHQSVPALGLAWANMVTTRLQMFRTAHTSPDAPQMSLRSLEVVFAPDLPNSKCNFVVTKSGVRGVT